jgi:hypothetical protein
MTSASRYRRRAFGGLFFLGGAVLLVLVDQATPTGLAWKCKLCAPMMVLVGLGGLAYPPSVPDPRPEGGAIAAVSLLGSRSYAIGLILGVIGFCIGAYWAFMA